MTWCILFPGSCFAIDSIARPVPGGEEGPRLVDGSLRILETAAPRFALLVVFFNASWTFLDCWQNHRQQVGHR